MGTIGGVISSLSSLAAKLLPGSSSSSSSDEGPVIETELNKLTRTLERIKATLYDAEEREIMDRSVKLWLKELKEVAYAAEDVLDGYQYEVLRVEVEARNASAENSHKRKKLELPDGMVDRIKETLSRFDEIANHREALQLREDDGPRRYHDEMRITPTSHMVVESNIFGRESEKEKLIDLICSDSNKGDVVSVVTIVGMGGLGKTTVAQLVYKDLRIRQQFDQLGWVCVSEDFSVERLTRDVLESITKESCGLRNLSVLQEKLEEKIKGKMIFLVLDDVWNEKRGVWELFRTPFLSTRLTKILVTTRNETVAQIMQTIPTFKLGFLSEEQCWQLFQHYAFGVANNIEGWKLEIGKRIMKKCGQLSLAVKSIASLLSQEANEESWINILESELWEVKSTNEIFQPLQISYLRLPSYLKPCLVYCSMFPKDYEYKVEELIHSWYAQGYIESKGRKNIQKIGRKYIMQLLERSLLDKCFDIYDRIYGTHTPFAVKLHDMIHDLARSNLGDDCYSIEYGKPPNFPKQIYHLYVDDSYELVKSFPLSSYRALRTLVTGHKVENAAIFSDISETHTFRVIIFNSQCFGFGFLNLISNLKHLRYLSLRNLTFQGIPDSICTLYNLESLILSECRDLVELPNSIGNLVSLQYLYLSSCSFPRFPESICTLYNLQTLTLSKCHDLVELPNSIGNLVSLQYLYLSSCLFPRFPESICYLKNLKVLEVSRCQLVELPKHIGDLISLEELVLEWCRISVLPVSFCRLKSLRKLYIRGCSDLRELPHGIENLTNLQTMIVELTKIISIPPNMRKLTGVETLHLELVISPRKNQDVIGWLNDVTDIKGTLLISGLENATSLADAKHANLINKHKLESLKLYWNLNAIGWRNPPNRPSILDVNIDDDGIGKPHVDEMDLFLLDSLQPHPNLKKLEIYGYRDITFPKWTGDPFACASIKEVSIVGCENLTLLPFGNLHNLKHLKIERCHSLQFIHAECFPSQLQRLDLVCCDGLISLPGIRELKFLVKLRIYQCSNLKSFWLESFHASEVHRLRGLTILSSLRYLSLWGCGELQLTTDEFSPVESCKVEVQQCHKLENWCLQNNFRYIPDEPGGMWVR